jgi:hypothetical protein
MASPLRNREPGATGEPENGRTGKYHGEAKFHDPWMRRAGGTGRAADL